MSNSKISSDDSLAGSIQQIYNLLVAGKKLKLDFADRLEAESFRVQLAKYKTKLDEYMISMDLMQEDQKQSLRFKIEKPEPVLPGLCLEPSDQPEFSVISPVVTAIIYFDNKQFNRKFSFEVLD